MVTSPIIVATHSRLLLFMCFFTRLALRAFHRSEIIHTLTLGEALMPAGLSVEGWIMRHARGPRRAWLKKH